MKAIIATSLESLKKCAFFLEILQEELKMANYETYFELREVKFVLLERALVSSDLFVCDVTFPTLKLGTLIGTAMGYSIPTILFQKKLSSKNVIPALLPNFPSEVNIYKYTDESVGRIIQQALEEISPSANQKLSIMLDKPASNYLEVLSKKRSISKGEYVKGLIEADMKKRKPKKGA